MELDESKPSDIAQLHAQNFLSALPFCSALGLEVVEITAQRVTLKMPYRPDLIGDPQTGVIHGGAVFALIDSCAGTVVTIHPEGNGRTATIDLRIDYMRAAMPGAVVYATASVYQVTRHVAFIRAEAHDGDPARPIAMGTGSFTFTRKPADNLGGNDASDQ